MCANCAHWNCDIRSADGEQHWVIGCRVLVANHHLGNLVQLEVMVENTLIVDAGVASHERDAAAHSSIHPLVARDSFAAQPSCVSCGWQCRYEPGSCCICNAESKVWLS
jgi:hypothetical protein